MANLINAKMKVTRKSRKKKKMKFKRKLFDFEKNNGKDVCDFKAK